MSAKFFHVIGSELKSPAREPPFRCSHDLGQLPFRRILAFSIPTQGATIILKSPGPSALQFIDFRCQDEIALGQTVDLMRPNRDFCFAPAKADIGMMPLLFRQSAD